jgi:hypothetical protein
MFNPGASVVGSQGYYGHFLGVNWVWCVGVVGIHIVYSVGLPILLLGLALPETRGRSLLSRRGISWAIGIYATDIVLLAAVIGYWRVAPVLLVTAAVLAVLLYAATSALPHGALEPTRPRPTLSPKWFFPLGLAFYPILFFVPGLGSASSFWPPADMALELLLCVLLFEFVRRNAGRSGNEAGLVMLALGAISPIAVLGALFQVVFPLVLVADVFFGLFFYTLWVRYRPNPTAVRIAPPLGAV